MIELPTATKKNDVMKEARTQWVAPTLKCLVNVKGTHGKSAGPSEFSSAFGTKTFGPS